VATAAGHAWNAVTHMFSPTRMARRVAQLAGHDLTAEIATIRTPTLVLVGEDGMDLVVPVQSTRQYANIIRGARVVTLARTGHLGSLTRPREFSGLVVPFATAHASSSDSRQHLG
jgi:pimeloyl-ACP methyl ester carboxylesterase